MKERPVLFSGPMVRAILKGRKTVTRRAVKQHPANGWEFSGDYGKVTSGHRHAGKFGAFIVRGVGSALPEIDIIPCPYGQPGDRLWVRETYADAGCRLTYRADVDDGAHCMVKKWTPSIHMPRSACRLLLEVTAVRGERLQDITRSDIRAEGLQCPPELCSDDVSPNYRDWYPAAWRKLWESTGGDWESNPWVWAVEFKRVMQ
ncbi:hypothetical protein [Pseudomonas nitroreducens]|uniref:hypothetical protein n=1 Tax=Pseudomonas nitroreducens TaxID=46680 RepID=UPI003D2B44AF